MSGSVAHEPEGSPAQANQPKRVGFPWDDRYLLGYNPMDKNHREFVDLVNRLLIAGDDAIPAAMTEMVNHLEGHFAEETQWMSEGEYPARECHVDEHEKVLASAREVMQKLAAGNVKICRSFAQALKDWFPGHADYMDSALSNWMVKKKYHGLPVVLKRIKPRA